MAYSKIVITQSASSGTPGVSRNDIVLSTLVTLTNDPIGNIGVATWEWFLIEAPQGSSVILNGTNTSTASFTPDVVGRYVISLRVNALGNSSSGYSEIVVGVPFISLGTDYNGESFGDYNPPAFHENFLANWGGNTKGAQPEIYKLFKNQRQIIIPSLFKDGDQDAIKTPIELPSSLIQSTNSGTPQIAGYSFEFNVADFPWVKSARFQVIFGRVGSAGTASVQLYDMTHSVLVASSSTSSTRVYESLALTIGSSPGNLRNDGSTQYCARVYMSSGGGGSDLAEIYDSGFLFEVV